MSEQKLESLLPVDDKVGSLAAIHLLSILTFVAVSGILKGFDQLLNLVLDQVEEEPSGQSSATHSFCTSSDIGFAEFQLQPRQLGLAVVRGPTVTLIAPADGFEEIADPFAGN